MGKSPKKLFETNLLYLAQTSGSVESIHMFLTRAGDELGRISRITRQTLSFHWDTRLPIAIDVGELLAGVIELFEKSAAARHIRVILDRQPTLTIYGYPGQLSQVLGNLVRNASEAAQPETDIVVGCGPSIAGGAKARA